MTDTSVEGMKKDHGSFLVRTTNENEIIADAIIVATGFDLFKSERKEEYGYGIYDNVITSADLGKEIPQRGTENEQREYLLKELELFIV